MTALYPFESRWLALRSGHRIHYVDEGAGPPLLFVHGNPTWSFHYRDLVRELRDRFRCVAVDHLGCGLSDKPAAAAYDIRSHAGNLGELLDALDLREVTLVVQDWGGPIGYLAAIRSPDRFSRLVTFNTGISLLPLPRMLTMLRLPLLGPAVIRGLNGMVRAGLLASGRSGRFSPEVRAGYLAPYDSWANRIAIHRFVQEIPLEENHPNRPLLTELAANLHLLAGHPHLVVWGLQDPVFGPDYLAAWRSQFPAAEVHTIADAGHWVADEAGDRVLPLLESFLMRTAAPAGP